MDRDFYFRTLYPLQDRILRAFGDTDTGFYLSGGTAASRGYCNTVSPTIWISSSMTNRASTSGPVD